MLGVSQQGGAFAPSERRGGCGTNGFGQRNAAATGALVALLLLVVVLLPGSKLSKLRTAFLAKNGVAG